MEQWEKTGWVECDAEDRIRLKFPVLDALERAEANRETGVGVKCELRLGVGIATYFQLEGVKFPPPDFHIFTLNDPS